MTIMSATGTVNLSKLKRNFLGFEEVYLVVIGYICHAPFLKSAGYKKHLTMNVIT